MRRRIVSVITPLAAFGLATLMVRGGVDPPTRAVVAQEREVVGVLPPHPYEKSTGDAYARFVFGADVPNDLVVEVRSIFIRAGGQSQLPSLPGPALLEVKNGTGTISLGKRRHEEDKHEDDEREDGARTTVLDPNKLTKLGMDQIVSLNNTGEQQPLVVQLYLFEAK